MITKVELGAMDWATPEGRFVHEATFTGDGGLTREVGAAEGAVRIVGADGARLDIYDDLTALAYHLGGVAPVRCLGEGAARHTWGVMMQPFEVEVRVDGDDVVVACRGSSVRAPATELWPALVAAALRFIALVDAARPQEPWRVDYLRESVARARELVAARGWTLPPRPDPDPPAPPRPREVVWAGAEVYVDHDEARAFFREVLGPAFDGVRVEPCLGGLHPPQWLGLLGGGDGEELAARAAPSIEMYVDTDRRDWLDPWDTNIGWRLDPPAAPAVARHVLRVQDPAAAVAHYAAWLGWRAEGDRLYLGDREMARVERTDDTAHWRHFLAVPDVAAAVARAVALGATVLAHDADSAWLADPHGGTFGLGVAPK